MQTEEPKWITCPECKEKLFIPPAIKTEITIRCFCGKLIDVESEAK